jgi:hypothetical protein
MYESIASMNQLQFTPIIKKLRITEHKIAQTIISNVAFLVISDPL